MEDFFGNRETTGPEFRVIHRVIHTIWRHITSYSVYHTQYAMHIMCIYGVPTVYQCVFSIFDQYHVYTHSRPLILHSVNIIKSQRIKLCNTRYISWSIHCVNTLKLQCVKLRNTHQIQCCMHRFLHSVKILGVTLSIHRVDPLPTLS